jgi:hypothetical protein
LPSEVIKLHAPNWELRTRSRNLKPHHSANGTNGRAGVMSQRSRSDQAHAITGYEWHTSTIH